MFKTEKDLLKEKIISLLAENEKLKSENVNLQLWNNDFKNECEKLINENRTLKELTELAKNNARTLIKENTKLKNDVYELSGDNAKKFSELQFLNQRNKELRQKSWYEVFEENLKLQEQLRQYQTVLNSVQSFINQYAGEKKEEEKGCH